MRSICLFLPAVLILLSGCASLMRNALYPYTDHARCIERCKADYKSSNQAYLEAVCRDRCNREFGWEQSRTDK
jgi:hypothetical protein